MRRGLPIPIQEQSCRCALTHPERLLQRETALPGQPEGRDSSRGDAGAVGVAEGPSDRTQTAGFPFLDSMLFHPRCNRGERTANSALLLWHLSRRCLEELQTRSDLALPREQSINRSLGARDGRKAQRHAHGRCRSGTGTARLSSTAGDSRRPRPGAPSRAVTRRAPGGAERRGGKACASPGGGNTAPPFSGARRGGQSAPAAGDSPVL